MAIGIFVVPIDRLFRTRGAPWKKEPTTPAAMVRKIHRVDNDRGMINVAVNDGSLY
jgi:hypothetical protein